MTEAIQGSGGRIRDSLAAEAREVFAVGSVQCALLHCKLFRVQILVCSVQCAVYSVQLLSIQCAGHIISMLSGSQHFKYKTCLVNKALPER